jgi:hypothetical protein
LVGGGRRAIEVMASAEDYREQIRQMGVTHMTVGGSSVAEAKSGIATLRRLQKQLRQIKRAINVDMKAIRAEYPQKMSTPAPVASSLATLLGNRKLAGEFRADAKRRLRIERDRKLAPYDELKVKIDDILLQMDVGKGQLQDYIEQVKSQQQPEQDAPEPVCSQCGGPTADSDAFCRWCGQKLSGE